MILCKMLTTAYWLVKFRTHLFSRTRTISQWVVYEDKACTKPCHHHSRPVVDNRQHWFYHQTLNGRQKQSSTDWDNYWQITNVSIDVSQSVRFKFTTVCCIHSPTVDLCAIPHQSVKLIGAAGANCRWWRTAGQCRLSSLISPVANLSYPWSW